LWRGTAGEKAPQVGYPAKIRQPFEFQTLPIAQQRHIRLRADYLCDDNLSAGMNFSLWLRTAGNGMNATNMAGSKQALEA